LAKGNAFFEEINLKKWR